MSGKRGKKGDGKGSVDFKPLAYSFSGTSAAPITTGTNNRKFGKWGMEGPYFTDLKRYAPDAGFGRNRDVSRNELWATSDNKREAELERVLEEAAAAGSSVEAVKAANRARLREAAGARAETLARVRAEAGYGAPAAGYGAPAAAAGYGGYGAPAPAPAPAAAGYGGYGAPAAAGYGASASGSAYPALPDPRNYIAGYGARYNQNFEGGSYTKKRNNRNNRKNKKASRKSRSV